MRSVSATIFGMAALTLVVLANAQLTEQAAREQARNAVRSELHSTVHFKSDQFVGIRRDEELEQSLAVAAGGRVGSRFVYRVSPTGYEIGEKGVVYHVWTDVDAEFIVAINPADGTCFRIHGFGFADSLTEFEKLMTGVVLKVLSPEQAQSVADFYRRVNPENLPLTPISSLIDLKQAAERQCQSGVSSFDAGQEAFTAWWKHAKPLYSEVSFKQTAAPFNSGYLVEWMVLSSAAKGNCGGSLLRAQLEVHSDGHVGKLAFSSFKRR